MRFWLCFLALFVVAQPAWGGKLAGAGKAAAGGLSPSSRANPPSHSQSGTPLDSGTYDGYGALIWLLMRLPIIVPQLALEGRGPLPFVYEAHPYANHGKGIVRTDKAIADDNAVSVPAETYDHSEGPPGERQWMPGEPTADDREPTADDRRPNTDDRLPTTDDRQPTPERPAAPAWDVGGQLWAAQVSVDGAAIDADVVRLRPRVRLFTPSRIELDAESSIYREQLHGADVASPGRDVDWMTLSAMHFALRFAQSQAVQFRVGMGPRLMTATDRAFMGWDVSYGVDAFIARPLILSGNVAIGQVGKSMFTEVRGSLGFVVGPVELMAGVERVAVGDTVLAGPTAGIRVWF